VGLSAEDAGRSVAGFRQQSSGSLNVNYPMWPEPVATAEVVEPMRQFLRPHYDANGLGGVPEPQGTVSDVSPEHLAMLLAAAEGLENQVIARTLGADENTVGKWRRRFAARRLDGFRDEPRPGAPRQIGDEEIAETIRLTLETTPPDATHWSLRSMAAAVGHAPSTIHEPAITAYIESVNANPRPFVWTKSADDILATIKRFCLATSQNR
jgi:transposase